MARRVKIRVELNRGYVLRAAGIIVAPHVLETVRRVHNRQKITAPVDKGQLRASHYMKIQVRPTSISGEAGASARHALPVHEGARPHVIFARRAKALRFHWAKVGAVTFVPLRGAGRGYTGYTRAGTFLIGKGYVGHPGNKARPWLYEAALEEAVPRGYAVRRSVGSTIV